MNILCYGLLVFLLYPGLPDAGALVAICPFIRHYEELSYDREAVHQQHERFRREILPRSHVVMLDFKAFYRTFRLRLKRDTTEFSDNFKIHIRNVSRVADLSHIYSGHLEGEEGSSCYGSIIEGQFDGFIQTENGTYYIEPLDRYSTRPSSNHSIIYHGDDIDLSPVGRSHQGFCGMEHLKHFAQSLGQEDVPEGEPVSRSKRTVDYSKTTCYLYLHVDYLYFKKFGSAEAVIAQIGSYMNAVNYIYSKVDFDGIRLINFKVKFLNISSVEDPSSLLSQAFIGPEKLLSLFSEENWDDYCLSYLLTNRDFSGVLGLAWNGMQGNLGGICSKVMIVNGGKMTRNTGLITLQKYGDQLTPRHIQLTLAHELGHSLGAPHDVGSNCGDQGSTGDKGRYLMFPYATTMIRENNDKFSPCSIKHISSLLKVKKDDCFVVSDQPICGNFIVEEGEECDIGHNESDPCCYSANEPRTIQCRLKHGKICSPSQGMCCSPSCLFKPYGITCEDESECRFASQCSGTAAACPTPGPKPNMTTCSLETRVCFAGECVQSLCVKYGLESCDCLSESMTEKCHMCCQQPGEPNTCASTMSSVLSQFFQGKRLALVAGTPCSDKQGYCDKFHACRLLDADGPIARLKNAFLHLDGFDDLSEWMKAYWWAILLAILAVFAVMAGTALLCGQPLEGMETYEAPVDPFFPEDPFAPGE
ncbi:disintegrin and metalloproteinase domain-containing protein 10 [Scleropages formosus]|uniref:ADAM10 endopeptidase n=1 Tax=Scleropages formosus TaxID=113540 RepID=A0A8C9RBN3_SCLFO|nr:disintegrin and metalloproteinase domain-containing protein 10-like [Scleropages formosus]